jgi:hypothetical protein
MLQPSSAGLVAHNPELYERPASVMLRRHGVNGARPIGAVGVSAAASPVGPVGLVEQAAAKSATPSSDRIIER